MRELATVATQDPWLHRRQRQVMAVETVTLWQFNIAIENDPFIVVLPINNGDFP